MCDSQLWVGIVDEVWKHEEAVPERVHRPHTPVLIQLQHVPEQTDKLPPINHVGQLVHRLRERRHVQLKHRHTHTNV